MTKIAINFLLFVFGALYAFSNSYAASNKEEYELQERCANSAKEFFKLNHGSGIFKTKYGQAEAVFTNHYNRKLNKCFVMTTLTDYVYKNSRPEYAKSFVITVLDINDNKECGRFYNIYQQDKPAFCRVEDKPCHDILEWEALIKPYMEE
ncbi:MAG: hypothetical protein NTW42_06275 [Deltaproteobacteria bacterium]|nr:hypothetical protein [Deltaproteobacteria bacterium]